MNKLNLLGCAWSNVPIIFDVAYETIGVRSFEIFKNAHFDGFPVMLLNNSFYQYQIYEPETEIYLPDNSAIFGVTGPKAKQIVFNHFNNKFNLSKQNIESLIHPTCYIASSTFLSNGIYCEPGVIIASQTSIGFGVSIKRGVNIGHHNSIGDYTEFNPGVITSGNVKIGKGCIIGVGAVIKNEVTIGDNTFIGMGSVVTKDIPEGVVAFGNPCKVIRPNNMWNIGAV